MNIHSAVRLALVAIEERMRAVDRDPTISNELRIEVCDDYINAAHTLKETANIITKIRNIV
jgi:hypothetical protein